MKIGVSSYSFNQYIQNGKMTPDDVIPKAKEMGFDAVEFTDFNLTSPEGADKLEYAKKIRKQAEKHGIELSAYVIAADFAKKDNRAEIERVKRQVDIANALGVKLFRHDVLSFDDPCGDFRSFELALPTVAEAVREVSEYAAGFGIKTMTENHGIVCQDSDRIEKLINTVNCDNYGALVDMGNFMCVDECPPKAVSRLAGLAFLVHAKDFVRCGFDDCVGEEGYFQTRGCNMLKGVSVGEGDAGAAQCIAILKKAGYDGYVDLEYEGVEDCIVGIKKSLEFLRKHCK